MIDTPTKTHFITKGQRIAQLLLLPYYSVGKTVTSAPRGEGGFGSSDIAFWLQEITSNRPVKQLIVEGIAIEGLLDTGADVSCIAGKDWPSSWPIQVTPNTLVGIGKAPQADKSSKILHWSDGENNAGTFQPYVIPAIPVTLWGRDVLAQMGVLLFSPDDKVTAQMLKTKYNLQKSLGKAEQEARFSIFSQPNEDKRGFGYESDCELSNLS